MARLRKEKGGKHTGYTSKTPSVKKAKGSKDADAVLKEQVLAFGGNQEDFDLVKGVSETTISSAATQDPTLSKDISKFLKDLTQNSHESPGTGRKGKGKDISETSSKKQKKEKAQKHAQAASSSVTAGSSKHDSQGAGKQEKGKDNSQAPSKKQKKEHAQKAAPETPPIVAQEPPKDIPKTQLPTKVILNPQSHFVFPPASQWYASIPSVNPSAGGSAITPALLSSLTSRAEELHANDIRTFQTSSSSSSEAGFLAKIIQSGTLSDRLSALTLLVQSSPLHNIRALETLKGMAERGKGKGGREESLKALRCIVDWWVGGGAPNRKLKYFRDQPLSNTSVRDEHLLAWYFEDWLKKYFFSVLQILETLSLDPLPYVRTQALNLIFTLLKDKPEQEQNLLRLLVNKLGDTEKALCSRASYHVLQIVQAHPAMKLVIVREIISLVLRPPAPPPTTSGLPAGTGKHIRFADAESKPKSKPVAPAEKRVGNAHARYYATITFNQIVLTHSDREVALKLIDVYFEMFKELLGEEHIDEGDAPDAPGEVEKEEVKVDKGGRVKDNRKKGKGKGKSIEVKGAAGFTEVEDAQSRLISAILTGVNRALPFAKIDAGDAGINKHIDTLFLITHTSTFNISLQALVLIQHITVSLASSSSASSSSTSKSITERYYRTLYASLHDPRLATSSKQAMYLNLLFKSIKADAGNADGERVKALIRRFVQLLVSGGNGATEFVAGGLFLLGELFSSIPGLRQMINQGPKEDAEAYDARKRDPQYAHASSSPLWELTPLLHHYHPAVSLHARQILTSQPLTASADLSQNTLSHFLDRFVYKNPKKPKASENGPTHGKGASAMQPAASGVEGVKLMKGEVESTRVNEVAFLRKKAEDVPVDQLFFHKYFSQKSEREKAKSSKTGKRKGEESSDDDEEGEEDEDEDEEGEGEGEFMGIEESDGEAKVDEEEEDSDEDEGEIWKAMQATMPKAVGEDDDLMEDGSDDDEIPSDLDDDSEDEDVVEEDDEDALSLVEGSDNEDLISLDGDIPDGLIDYDGSDAEGEAGADEEWGGIEEGGAGKKRKREETKGEKRKKLRSLPTFASYEDYAKMIEDGPEDDI